MIKFSFIIPFYNVEQYIEECVRSIYDQDIPLEEYEVICVNDCSPDNSVDVVKRLQKEFSNLILIEHTENKKQGGARNTGLKFAKGEYIWFVDSDDCIMPNVLNKVYDILSNNNIDFLQFGYNERKENSIIKCSNPIQTNIIIGPELFFDNRFIWWKSHITPWSKVYKKSFLIENDIIFAEHVQYEDNDYAFKVYDSAKRCMHISENLYVYRMNDMSITRTKFNATHIYYWLMLIQRLVFLSHDFKKRNSDIRFQNIIREFIKNTYWNLIKVYKGLDIKNKQIATKYIRKYTKITFIPYIKFINYIKCKTILIRLYN